MIDVAARKLWLIDGKGVEIRLKREREFLFRSSAKLYGRLTGGAVQEGRKETPTVPEIVFAAESIFLHNQRAWQDSFVSIDFLAVY